MLGLNIVVPASHSGLIVLEMTICCRWPWPMLQLMLSRTPTEPAGREAVFALFSVSTHLMIQWNTSGWQLTVNMVPLKWTLQMLLVGPLWTTSNLRLESSIHSPLNWEEETLSSDQTRLILPSGRFGMEWLPWWRRLKKWKDWETRSIRTSLGQLSSAQFSK